MNYNKLKEEIKEKKFTIEEIANKIEMSREGLTRSINDEKLKIDILEKICDIIGVSPIIFFDADANHSIIQFSNGNGNSQKVSINKNEYELIQKLLEDKERIIQEKERMIQILLNKL